MFHAGHACILRFGARVCTVHARTHVMQSVLQLPCGVHPTLTLQALLQRLDLPCHGPIRTVQRVTNSFSAPLAR